MAQLMRRDPEELRVPVTHAVKHDTRIFHSGSVPAQIDGIWPWIFVPLRRKILDGVFDVFR